MNVELGYLGHSGVDAAGALRFAPNLFRPPTFFDAALRRPVPFREAMSALHAVVVGDLKRQVKDRSAHEAYKARLAAEATALRKGAASAFLQQQAGHREPEPPNLDADFRKMHTLYWRARRQWADELSRSDPALFRALVPCDPIITVAPDAVFFECFSKDESSYAMLSVGRDAFAGASESAGLGTTNVDYSLSLFEHFQTLRSYRETRLAVDPQGFDVRVEGLPDYREEKIDLPASWLRGFGQVQAASFLPGRRVVLPVWLVREALGYLRRHREKTGPRALRFELEPGRRPVVVIEPWGVTLASDGPAYDGPQSTTIKVWGRRRLFALGRVLPLARQIEVRLLGTGLPSTWLVRMDEMAFQLSLSGWTENDWSGSAALDLLLGLAPPDHRAVKALAQHLEAVRVAPPGGLSRATGLHPDAIQAALIDISRQGRAVYDAARDCVRYRPVLQSPIVPASLGEENAELVGARKLLFERAVALGRDERLADGSRLLTGKAGSEEVEALLDADGLFKRARCGCNHIFRNGLRKGPCRHLLGLRLQADLRDSPFPTGSSWMQ